MSILTILSHLVHSLFINNCYTNLVQKRTNCNIHLTNTDLFFIIAQVLNRCLGTPLFLGLFLNFSISKTFFKAFSKFFFLKLRLLNIFFPVRSASSFPFFHHKPGSDLFLKLSHMRNDPYQSVLTCQVVQNTYRFHSGLLA